MDDVISRRAAIDAECEVCQIAPKKERGHNCTYYVHGCKEIECLRELPSAQPTIEPRKKGKWISCENETGEGSNTYKCSACGEIQMMLDGTPKENGWKYCPHCAAKMDEDNENG